MKAGSGVLGNKSSGKAGLDKCLGSVLGRVNPSNRKEQKGRLGFQTHRAVDDS